MPKPRVYIETTIPNFYYETRKEPDLVARRNWTREWWTDAAEKFKLLTGSPVLAELAAGTSERVPLRQALLQGLPVLFSNARIDEIVDTYVWHKVMPADPREDAVHLALASVHECDFIVTWNCKHLANVNKFRHIERINSRLGLHVPRIVTPRELLGG